MIEDDLKRKKSKELEKAKEKEKKYVVARDLHTYLTI